MLDDMTVAKSRRGLAGVGNGAGEAPDEAPSAPTGEYRVIRDSEAAEVLMNPAKLRHLAPFLGRACSVTAAAEETGERSNTVLKRVRRFVGLGLVEVTRAVPRRGRPVKLYRTTGDVFFVPFEATAAESLEAALAERDGYWERLLRRNVVRSRMEALGNWGTRVYRDSRGRLQVQTAVTPEANATTLDPEAPAVLSAWRESVTLDFADAKALQREMFDLLMRYQQKAGAQRYIVRLGLAPVIDG
jgi:hypothetical protein